MVPATEDPSTIFTQFQQFIPTQYSTSSHVTLQSHYHVSLPDLITYRTTHNCPSHCCLITTNYSIISSPHVTLWSLTHPSCCSLITTYYSTVSSPCDDEASHHSLITMCHTTVLSPLIMPQPHHHPTCCGLITTCHTGLIAMCHTAVSSCVMPLSIHTTVSPARPQCRFNFLKLTVCLSYDGGVQ